MWQTAFPKMDTTIYPIQLFFFFFGPCDIIISSTGWWGLRFLPMNLGRPLCPPQPTGYSGSDSMWLWDKVIWNSCISALLSWDNWSWNWVTTLWQSSSYMDMSCIGAPANSPAEGLTNSQHQLLDVTDWGFRWLQSQPAESLPAPADTAWSRDELSLPIPVQIADLWIK